MKQEPVKMFGVYGISDNIKYFQGDFMACTLYVFRHTEDKNVNVCFLRDNVSNVTAIMGNYKIHAIG